MSQVTVARQEWEEGSRRLEAAREDPGRYRQLLGFLDLVLDELRKRIGQTYTLGELVAVYGASERWAREVLEELEQLPVPLPVVARGLEPAAPLLPLLTRDEQLAHREQHRSGQRGSTSARIRSPRS